MFYALSVALAGVLLLAHYLRPTPRTTRTRTSRFTLETYHHAGLFRTVAYYHGEAVAEAWHRENEISRSMAEHQAALQVARLGHV